MSKVISKDGTTIAFNKIGTGLPVILVDGALCSRDFGPMPKLAQLLASDFTVFTYDRRGRHESGNNLPYSVEREIEDIEALIKEAGGQVYIAGISSGAALALKATAAGLDIKKLAMYEPPYVVDQEAHHPPADSFSQLSHFISSGQRGEAVKFFFRKMIGLPAFVVMITQLMPVWKKLKAVAHTLPYDAVIMGDFSLPGKLAATIKIPSIAMGGKKSPVSMQHAVEKLAETIPNAKLLLFEGQTHNVSQKVLAPALVDFLKD